MRKPISRQSFPPPLRGRRIPVAKAKEEDRPNARDLLATVNSASSGASTSWIAFLGTMAYLAVTLGGVTHVELLLDKETTLPFVGVKVPLATFFVMAPLAFVLVHFSLLLQHVMLSRKLAAFEERLAKEEPSRDRSTQNIRDELHSFTFTQVASGKPKSSVVDMAQRLVISLTLVVFPMLLLTFFQIGFLPYHSEPITWWHRGMLALDAGVVWCLARHLVRVDPTSKIRLTDWWHATSRTKWRLIIGWRSMLDRARSTIHSSASPAASLVRPLFSSARHGGASVIRSIAPTRAVIVALLVFSACVATLPDDHLDKATVWVARNWLPRLSEPLPYCRDILDDRVQATTDASKTGAKGSALKSDVSPARAKQKAEIKYKKKCPEVTSAARHAFYPTAYLFEHWVDEASGNADSLLGWSRNLIVTDKDLAVAAGDKKKDDKKEKRLNLRGRDLRYAAFDRSKLSRADFYGTNLGGARLIQTDLNGANCRSANLQGADLFGASLQGADLTLASLQGAVLSGAHLQGAVLFGTSMQGAVLFGASMQGADLRQASLQGADLHLASVQGADLGEARLQGADLREASLQGADLREASLQGADLREASLQGADLSGARLWRNDAPGKDGSPVGGDDWTLVSSTRMGMRPLDDKERKDLGEVGTQLEQLQNAMANEGASGRERVEAAVKIVVAKMGALLDTKDDNTWAFGEDRKAWCKLATQPPPDPVKLSAYLGKLACGDDTDKAYMAQRLIGRVLDSAPVAFLEAFKGCPAIARIPADLKSLLERAAQEDKENTAKRKPETPASKEQPASPEVPAICVEKPATTEANTPTKP